MVAILHKSLLFIEFNPNLFDSDFLIFFGLPELVLEIHKIIEEPVFVSSLTNIVFISGTCLSSLTSGEGLTFLDLDMGILRGIKLEILLVAQNSLLSLSGFIGELSKLKLLLFFDCHLIDISLNLHPLKLVRVLEL